MNTPAHITLNLLCLSRWRQDQILLPGVIGAILPDAPMFVFYAVAKLQQIPERTIWSETYFLPHWQDFIDVFNSLPLIVCGWALMLAFGSTFGVSLFASMFLHVLGDLPLHHDDGHRHFFPLSDWRFESPVSYWDPNHHGGLASTVELVAVLISTVILWRLYRSFWPRLMLGLIWMFFGAYFVYVVNVWL